MRVKRYTTREARENLAELLRAARDGEEVVITSRNEVPVRLVAQRESARAALRARMETAVEIDEDPLAGIRECP